MAARKLEPIRVIRSRTVVLPADDLEGAVTVLQRLGGEIAALLVEPVQGSAGMLPLDMDPKLAWALVNRALFPMDVNTASREELLRVPGLGVKSVNEIVRLRRLQRLRLADVTRLARARESFRPFIVATDWRPGSALDSARLAERLAPAPRQLSLF